MPVSIDLSNVVNFRFRNTYGVLSRPRPESVVCCTKWTFECRSTPPSDPQARQCPAAVWLAFSGLWGLFLCRPNMPSMLKFPRFLVGFQRRRRPGHGRYVGQARRQHRTGNTERRRRQGRRRSGIERSTNGHYRRCRLRRWCRRRRRPYCNNYSMLWQFYYLSRGKEVMFHLCLSVCLSVCLSICLAVELLEKLWHDFDKIFHSRLSPEK